jgi:hypothetical protein
VTKRYLISVAAHNLGRILRKLFGVSKPKALQGHSGLAALAQLVILRVVAYLWRLSAWYQTADGRIRSAT